MRKTMLIAAVSGSAILLAGCGNGGMLGRKGPDEFAVARQAPLVIPPDFSLRPPQPGAPRPQDTGGPSQQALDALFGGTAARSAAETSALDSAGRTVAEPGVRSSVGSPDTSVVDKGSTTRDIVAAPQGDGRDAQTGAQGSTPTPPQD